MRRTHTHVYTHTYESVHTHTHTQTHTHTHTHTSTHSHTQANTAITSSDQDTFSKTRYDAYNFRKLTKPARLWQHLHPHSILDSKYLQSYVLELHETHRGAQGTDRACTTMATFAPSFNFHCKTPQSHTLIKQQSHTLKKQHSYIRL